MEQLSEMHEAFSMLPFTSFTMVLQVCNEEARIRRVLDYYSRFGRIIVIDNNSTDNSASIAGEFGCRVISISNEGSAQTPEWFRHVFAQVDTTYVLLLSCSEFIPPKAMVEYNRVAQEKCYKMVTNVVISHTCGEDIQIWGGRFTNIVRRTERFFNRDELDYDAIFIHAPFRTRRGDDVLHLLSDKKYNIVHLRDSDIRGLTSKHLAYAMVEAEQIVTHNGRISVWRLLNLVVSDLIRFIRLPFKKKNLISTREIWARVMMHITIYFLVREQKEGKGIEYSREKSNELWSALVLQQSTTTVKE
jgi:glycosyltransferase involved in cell wall biosynthesis